MSEVLDKIDFAVRKTLDVHPEFDFEANFRGYLREGYNPVFFTSQDGARDVIKTVTPDDFIKEIIRFGFECGMLYEKVHKELPEYKGLFDSAAVCFRFYKKFYKTGKDPLIYLKMNPIILEDITGHFGRFRYHNFVLYTLLLKKYNIECNYDYNSDFIPNDDLISVKNLRPNIRAINKCREDVMDNKQFQLSQVEYDVDGKVFAISDVGLKRDKQEDGVLITSHPDNPEYRLVAVADGMGGVDLGEKGSNETLKYLCEWFENLDVENLDDPSELNPLFAAFIRRLNEKLYKEYGGKAGTTLALIIALGEDTFVASIGDSRVYMMKDFELTQIIEDQSYVQKLFKNKIIKTKDDMRFHPQSNIITNSIGTGPEVGFFNMRFVSGYDLIMLFTDGVTDCISDEKIKLFASNSNISEIAKDIVFTAKYSISERINKADDEVVYADKIVGGKDNLTAAIYDPGRGR